MKINTSSMKIKFKEESMKKYLAIVSIFVAFAITAYASTEAAAPSKAEMLNALALTEGDKTIGNRNAPVILIEYSSLSCPHCAQAHIDILPEIIKEYVDTGRVLYVHRDMPLNKPAFDAARIAHCSGDNYFKMIDNFFKKQEYWAFTQDYMQKLEKISEDLGMTSKSIEQCMANKKLVDNISNRSMQAMKVLQVDSTPMFFANDQRIEGAKSLKYFKTVLDDELAKAKRTNGSKS